VKKREEEKKKKEKEKEEERKKREEKVKVEKQDFPLTLSKNIRDLAGRAKMKNISEY
jgi:hypothetical protein